MIAHLTDPTFEGFPPFALHPDVLAFVVAVSVGFAWAIRRHGAEVRAQGLVVISRWQVLCLVSGIATMLVASEWPIHQLAEERWFSIHMVQHTAYSLIAAPLLLLGTPAWLARRILVRLRLLGALRFWSRFVPATLLFNLVLVVTHVPGYVNRVVGDGWLHFFTHVLILGTALVVWMPIVSPLPEVPRLQAPLAMLYLFLQSIVPTVPASFLTFGARPLYHYYDELPRLWGLSALADMQAAGMVMKIFNGLLLWAVIAIVFFRWYDREEPGGMTPRKRRTLDRELIELTEADHANPATGVGRA